MNPNRKWAVGGWLAVAAGVALVVATAPVVWPEGEAAAGAAAAMAAPRPFVSSFRVRLSTGVDLHYVLREVDATLRPGSGPIDEAVVLLHGVTDSWRSYEELLARFPLDAFDGPVFALDQRGHGASSRPAPVDYSQPAMAADVAAFLDALQIRKAIVVGHSMGGLVAHRFAVDYPERLSALVLIGAGAGMAGHPVIEELRPAIDAFAGDAAAPVDFVTAFQASCFHPSIPPHVLYRYVAESLRLSGETWKAVFAGIGEEDHRERLPGITAPVLVLWGEEDAVISRAEVDELMRLLPGARLVTFPGAGHTVQVERTDAVAAALRAFLAQALPAGVVAGG